MSQEIISIEQVARRILYFRGEKDLLDFDLAVLYGVGVKVLNQAVKRNRERFPDDFMFQLTDKEIQLLRSQLLRLENRQVAENEGTGADWSQIVTSSQKYRGTKYCPYALTEEGVAMLSSALKSKRAVKVNIAIMRAFVKLRQTLDANRQLARKFSELEERVEKHDDEIAAILEAIRQLMTPPERPRREIGFHVREEAARYRTHKRA
jgi:phage regulator Rha-like protein